MKTAVVVLVLFYVMPALAQNPNKIKIKKQDNLVYFYQKGTKSDTITSQSNNLFYFILSDTLKYSTRLFIDNGTFIKTKNDSVIQFIFMPGLKYEAKYTKDKLMAFKQFKFKSLINGATSYDKNQIVIQVISNLQDNPLIENKFYFINR